MAHIPRASRTPILDDETTSVTDDQQVQAGWYPDPLGLPQLRWWDSHAWTEHTSDARRPLIPQTVRSTVFAEPAEPVAPAEPVQPAAAPEPEPAPEPQSAPEPEPAPEPVAAPAPAEPTADIRPPAAPAATANAHAALPVGTSSTPELGWAGAALTLHSVQNARVPMFIELDVAGHPPITIDIRYQAYDWQLTLDRFPDAPVGVQVSVELVDDARRPPFELPGQSLDTLLWKIGCAAFPDRIAPWLRGGERYRLHRWPNLTALHPDMDQMRQTAMLANGVFTIEQLAGYSGRSIEPTRTLINALSLMGALTVAPPEYVTPVMPVAPVAATVSETGLFGRLRERLGL